jgi:hypothetical protein
MLGKSDNSAVMAGDLLCCLFGSAGFGGELRPAGERGGGFFKYLIYPGGHTFPKEAPDMIIRFFKENA